MSATIHPLPDLPSRSISHETSSTLSTPHENNKKTIDLTRKISRTKALEILRTIGVLHP